MFEAHWKPVAERLGLAFVPMMITGFTVLTEDLPDIREELCRLHADLVRSSPGDRDHESLQTAVEGVLNLVAELDALQGEPGWSAYLG